MDTQTNYVDLKLPVTNYQPDKSLDMDMADVQCSSFIQCAFPLETLNMLLLWGKGNIGGGTAAEDKYITNTIDAKGFATVLSETHFQPLH